MPNELCGTCGKEKCPSILCKTKMGCSMKCDQLWCHGNCHPDDSGKVCGCNIAGCQKCHPTFCQSTSCSSPKSDGKCWACEKRGRLCEKHAEAYIPTPSDKDGEDWEVEFDKEFQPNIICSITRYKKLKSFIRSHLQHQRILGRREQWERDKQAVDNVPIYAEPFGSVEDDKRSEGQKCHDSGVMNASLALDSTQPEVLQSVSPDNEKV